MALEQSTCEDATLSDLKAFERRLTEIVQLLHPPTTRWRVALIIVFMSACTGAYMWLRDANTSEQTLCESLMNHWFFTVSMASLILLILMGVHRRVVMAQIIIQRARSVLDEYNMDCDDMGMLILKPRPTARDTNGY